MSLDNKFFFIGEAQHSYAPLGNRPVNWANFSEWLADFIHTDSENITCGDMFDGKELILADDQIVGCFGGPLDHAPTREEIEADGETV